MSGSRTVKTRKHRWIVPVGFILAAAAAGYWISLKPGGTEPAGMTVQQTFDHLRECRQAGAYGAMRPYIHASGREAAIDLLIAVDELVLSNQAALAVAQQTCPKVDRRRYDLSVIQDNLELFSRDVQLISVEEAKERSTVTVKISGRLPLVRLAFVRERGNWQYVPGPENPAVLDAVRQLTRTLNQMELALAGEQLTPDQIEDEYRIRLAPKLRKLSAASEDQVVYLQH